MKTDSTIITAPVSVVIPMYNAINTIGRALDSILQQKIQPSEVIVVDDFSKDNCMNHVIENYFNEFSGRLLLVSHMRNSGPGSARNLGIDIAKNQLIAFLDSDDTWHAEKIEVQYAVMMSSPEIMLSGHPISEATSTHPAKKSSKHFQIIPFNKLLRSNLFSTPSVMIRKVPELRFPEDGRFSEDYLFWLRYASQYKVALINEVLGYIYKPRFGHSGLSSNLVRMAFGELSNYRTLHKEGRLSAAATIIFSLYSASKSLRRIINHRLLKV